MKILIAGGGSGGHIFPAFALIYELSRLKEDIDFTFIISGREEEKKIVDYFKEKAFKFKSKIIPLIPLNCRDAFALVKFFYRLVFSFVCVFLLVLRERPKIAVGFGGYVSVPVVLSAFLSGVPTLLHEQNVYPGRANFILANFARKIALSFEESKGYFKNRLKLTVTGNPLREDIKPVSREIAAGEFGIRPELFTILVLGGSQGASQINRNFSGLLREVKIKELDLQFVHITGRKDFSWVDSLYRELGLRARVFAFCDKMNLAYACSDLVVTRAGATTLNELSFLAKAAVAVPYPYSGAHQLLNARYYARRNALIVIEEKELSPSSLFNCIYGLMKDKQKMNLLSQEIKGLNKPSAAKLLAEETWSLIYAD